MGGNTLNTYRNLFVALVVLTAGPASYAQVSIPGLFNTGVDNSGANLPFGTVDPHWVISNAPSFFGPAAFANNPRPNGWVANTTQSQWVGPTSNGTSNVFGGTYVYDLSFDLTGLDETTAVIQGLWASDDGSTIHLNGVNTGFTQSATGGPFGAFDSFTINSGFVPGINTLRIRVNNNSGGGFGVPNGTPNGLHVTQLSGQAQLQIIPEPSTLSLLSLAGLVTLTARRARARLPLPSAHCVLPTTWSPPHLDSTHTSAR